MPPRTSPKALLLDIGDVVIRDPRPRIVREIVRREHLDPVRVRDAYYRVARRLALGSIGLPEAYSILRRSLRWEMPYDEFRALVSSRALIAVPGVLPVLRSLHRARTVRVVFASNVERATWEGLCRKFRLHEYADAQALSYRLRTMKPGHRFYRAALRIAHASPDEALFLDDLTENVRGARRVGIPSRTVRSPSDAVGVLQRLTRAVPSGR
jgi:HAD superfamily hydrolase (TIGR01509 family)